MENKDVGYLIIGIAIVVFFIVISFNNALETVVNASCNHGTSCPMQVTLKNQKTVSYGLMSLLVAAGVFVSYFMKDKEVVRKEKKHLSKEEKHRKLENLDEEEKQVMNIVLREDGSIYQSDLVKETGLSKVKVSRLLDRIEGKGLIERKRRGMTNIVVLKHGHGQNA